MVRLWLLDKACTIESGQRFWQGLFSRLQMDSTLHIQQGLINLVVTDHLEERRRCGGQHVAFQEETPAAGPPSPHQPVRGLGMSTDRLFPKQDSRQPVQRRPAATAQPHDQIGGDTWSERQIHASEQNRWGGWQDWQNWTWENIGKVLKREPAEGALRETGVGHADLHLPILPRLLSKTQTLHSATASA
eukprot:6456036-Amphidinium_carterae.1